MKFAYQFEQLCGSVYTDGNVLFTPDGNSLLSPVGNRVTMFDLVNHKTKTFGFENRCDIECIAVSNDSRLMIVVDKDGRSLLVHLKRGVVLYRFNFKCRVRCIEFSPDDKYIAVGVGKKLEVWYTPSGKKEFAPFVKLRNYTGHHGDIVSVNWSSDSRFIVSGSKDLTAKIFSIKAYEGYRVMTLVGHRDAVVGAFFTEDMKTVYTLGKDGGCYVWKYNFVDGDDTSVDQDDSSDDDADENEVVPELGRAIKWYTWKKQALKQDYAKVVCCTYHLKMELLVVGFSNGTFGLYDTPDLNNIHTLSISQNKISTVAVNASGEWLAFGSKKLGQLLVWEWKSETYVLKQQGHFFDLNVLDYSPNGQMIATGSDDAKVKLWHTTNGFCFATFSDHTGPVTGVQFTSNGSAVVSASLDGTVRAYDTERYKNFRTLTTPNPVQFTALALDASGQIVCAGTRDPFNIFVWSLQTRRLIDVLSGHEGPITSLSFSPSNSSELVLASSSWDHTIRLWNVYENKSLIEPLIHSHDVLAVAFRPDGEQLCCATLNGNISIWNVTDGELVGTIEGRRDISGGRKSTDRITAQNNSISKYFTSVCYSADGTCIIAGGESKFICIYEVSQQLLLKKYQLSHNRSLEGVLDMLHSGDMTAIGPKSLVAPEELSDDESTMTDALVGAKRAVDPGSRRKQLAIRSKCVIFSPTGRAWAAASTEGLLIYSLDENMLFDPFDLDEEITPSTIEDARLKHQFSKCLLMSLHLNEENIIQTCVESVPLDSISLVVESLREQYLKRFLEFLCKRLEMSPHIEFYLQWCRTILQSHGNDLRNHLKSAQYQSTFRALQKGVSMHLSDLSKLCNDNMYSLDYLCNVGQLSLLTEN